LVDVLVPSTYFDAGQIELSFFAAVSSTAALVLTSSPAVHACEHFDFDADGCCVRQFR
jgi:hypothetical protein